MNKTLCVAWREFCATALTKGFIIAVVMTPLLMLVVIAAVAVMKDMGSPRIVGSVAVIDYSGVVAPELQKRFSDEGTAAEAKSDSEKVKQALEQQTSRLGLDENATKMATGQVDAVLADVAATGPRLTLELLPPDADLAKEKAPLADVKIETTKSKEAETPVGRIALITIPAESVKGDASGKFASFQAFFAEKVDFEITEKIQRRVGESIVDARLRGDSRLSAASLSPDEVRLLLARPGVESKEVSKEGEKKSMGELKFLLPIALMILMMVSVFTSGQYLLTSTVEEKGNRVMEVLLSAVSPMQLMAGKIIGQMAVGLVILVLYSGLAIFSLVTFVHQANVLDGWHIAYLFVYFGIAYFFYAAMMAAIGAAVNEMREAQALMSPAMVVLMIPWLTWFLIQRAPNAPLATILSFVPGPSPFVMVIRLSGSEPIPAWQIPATMVVGILSVFVMLWAAAKIFRVGALMHGKPPNLRTLFKWVRMA